MDTLWRIGLISFALAALVSVGMLAALWTAWSPVMPAVSIVAGQSWFAVAELVLLGITAAGLVGMIVFALAAPRASKRLFVRHGDGGVNISQTALRSVVEQTIARHRGLRAESVHAKAVGKKNPRLKIRAKVNPGTNVDLGELGSQLQHEIADAVEHFASCPVKTVDLTFVQPISSTSYASEKAHRNARSSKAKPASAAIVPYA